RPHPVGPPLEQLVARHAPAEVVAGRGDVAVQAQVHGKGQFPHGVSLPVSRYSAYRPTRRGKFIGQTTARAARPWFLLSGSGQVTTSRSAPRTARRPASFHAPLLEVGAAGAPDG